ncbi:TonB-dependent receptor [Niveispirillum sp. KHB5.9]|uniref:TonB-dependent receptor n=1 Tax=Niveispirillum sp. KHB5.9 TaxID=3400269 RepID=UPI003A85236B
MIGKRTRPALLRAGVALLALVTAQNGQAQTAPAGDGLMIEEIIVSARRRLEPLQTTPVAVTALAEEALREQAVSNIADVGRLAPNLQIATGRNSSSIGFIFIRGVGQADESPTADPGVAQYVDDVYLGRLQGGLVNISDVASVEVLRGPQGTLYGKNTIGGALKINSKLPGPDTEYAASLAYGNYDSLSAKASVSLPLVDDALFWRLSVDRSRNDGFMRNHLTGTRGNDQDVLSGRTVLRYNPSEDIDILLSVDGSRDRSAPYYGFVIETAQTEITPFIKALIGDIGTHAKSVHGDIWNGGFDAGQEAVLAPFSPNEDVWGAFLRASYGGDELNVKSITAYREIKRDRMSDADASPLSIGNFADRMDQWQASQEFQVSGEALDGRLNWLGGLFYYQEDVGLLTMANLVPAFVPLGLDQTRDQQLDVTTKSYAAFLNASYDLTDKLSGSVGLRYTSERKSIFVWNRSIASGATIFGPTDNARTFEDLSPRIGLDYEWSPEIFTYASLSKGFKSGGFNYDPDTVGTLQPYNAEKVWAYEAGVKTQWFDRRLTVNLAAFYTDYKDIQLQVFAIQNGTIFQPTANAGKAHVQGLEVETRWQAGGGFTLYGAGALTDAAYDEYQDAVLGDVSDRKFVYTPKYSGLVGLAWEGALSENAAAHLDINYSAKSRTWHDPQNTRSIAQGGYGLLNARAALRFQDDRLEVAAYGKNLTDKAYVQNGASLLDSLGYAIAFAGAPRTYGLEVNWRY